MSNEAEGLEVNVEAVIAGLKSKEKWSEEEGRVLLEVFEGSGLAPTAFCRRHGLKPHRLWWRLGKRTGAAKRGRPTKTVPVAFAPVRLVGRGLGEGRRSAARSAEDEWLQVVLSNGRRVVVGPRFEAPALVRLVNVLEGISC